MDLSDDTADAFTANVDRRLKTIVDKIADYSFSDSILKRIEQRNYDSWFQLAKIADDVESKWIFFDFSSSTNQDRIPRW